MRVNNSTIFKSSQQFLSDSSGKSTIHFSKHRKKQIDKVKYAEINKRKDLTIFPIDFESNNTIVK